MSDRPDELPDGATSIRLGAAVLRPMKERDHFGLFRPIIFVRRDGTALSREQHDKELGPLAVYRRKRAGDKDPAYCGVPGMIRTMDPQTNEPIEAILVWRPEPDDYGGTL